MKGATHRDVMQQGSEAKKKDAYIKMKSMAILQPAACMLGPFTKISYLL